MEVGPISCSDKARCLWLRSIIAPFFFFIPPFLPTHTPSTPPSAACKGGTLACEELKWTIAADSSRNRARAACMTEVYRQACTDSNISGAGLQGAVRTGSAPRSGFKFPMVYRSHDLDDDATFSHVQSGFRRTNRVFRMSRGKCL